MARHKFTVKLIGREGSQVAGLKPPFDVVGKCSGAKAACR